MRSLFTYLTFPVLMGGTVALVAAAMAGGVDPSHAVGAGQVFGILGIALMERLHPYQRQWLSSHGDMRTDTTHALVNFAVTEGLSVGLVAGLAGGAAALAAYAPGGLWPSDWPWVAQLGLALVVGEFGAYWVHRLLHEVPRLWPLHAPHHSPRRLYWLNAARFHPIDLALGQIASMTPLVLLGASPEALALTATFTAVHGMFQHANINLRLGPLNWIFSMAELHRWHHSKNLDEANSNYGGNLILWDIVFGTRFLPDDREPPTDIGIADAPDFPEGYVAQLLSPLRASRED